MSTCFERTMLIDRLIISLIHYLLSAVLTIVCIESVVERELRLAFRAVFILIISKCEKRISPWKFALFVGLIVNERNLLLKIGKRMV